MVATLKNIILISGRLKSQSVKYNQTFWPSRERGPEAGEAEDGPWDVDRTGQTTAPPPS